ncbi:MAG: cytochrome c-type biogenesis protein CcmH [Candidatus Binatus sp.]|uniref:cytochrome c-type biogenesis protein n=1 Tax=Candidatus Binatus sp. TaxID=2811406 RepID=UPI00271B3910|nr:cytochrome c-type biogenesis protein [Candidatus Binatus sp.]MDO8432060.1 cytochrome c-type biogenesis protein CcmH [Candidatus Binatus sp.]
MELPAKAWEDLLRLSEHITERNTLLNETHCPVEMTLRFFIAIGFVVATIVGSGGARQAIAAERPTQAQVSESLTCQCGCGLTVANCNMPTCSFAAPIRAEIDQMIGSGMSGAQIVAFYRHKFGEKVLSAPTAEGFNLLAWTMPFLAIVIGGGLIVLAFGRWRSAAGESAPATPAGIAIGFDPALRRRLEDDLKENS